MKYIFALASHGLAILWVGVWFLGISFFLSPALAEEKPLSPQNVASQSQYGSKSITISWQKSETADIGFYRIYRSTLQSNIGTKIITLSGEIGGSTYTDTGILYNTTYYYRMTSVKSDIESDYSNIVSTKAILPAPVNISAKDVESKLAIQASWQSPAQGLVLWYDLYRSTSSTSNGSKIASKIKPTEYIDSAVNHDTIYYYRVVSVDEAGNKSDYSEAAQARAVAEFDSFAPTGVSARTISNNGVQVSWSAPKYVTVSSYLVYRSGSETDLGSLRAETSNRSFSEYALDQGAVYYYQVKAVLSNGTISKPSDPARAEIKSGSQETILQPVSSVLAEATGQSGEIKLTWKNPSSASFSYVQIYRGTKSAQGSALIADKIRGTSFLDKKLENGFTYYYTIRTISKTGTQGALSEEASSSPFLRSKKDSPPPPLSRLRIKDEGDGKALKLTWQNPLAYLYDHIKIYRSEYPESIGKTIINKFRGNEYIDSPVTAGQRYFYTLKTISVNGVESENNITARGIATTALEGEGGANDADQDGLPDWWEREYGFNAHLKDILDEDEDKDGLNTFDEYQNQTDPYDSDSDDDGYSDGTEVLNGYNPLGQGKASQVDEITKNIKQGNFAYEKNRLSSIKDEEALARELKVLLEYEFGSGKIPNPKTNWPKLVNAYVYGGYTPKEISHTLKYGPGLVHPSVSADIWRASAEYKKKQ